MGILSGILGKRDPVVAYRTVDGGHPAPYPDMTDEQLYNYELAFNVPKKTFDRPPGSTLARQRQGRREPEFESREEERTERPGTSAGRHEPSLDGKRFAGTGSGRYAMPTGATAQQEEAPERPSPRKEPPAQEPPKREPPPAETVLREKAPNFDSMPPLDFSRPIRTVTTKQPVEIITTKARHPVYKVQGYIADSEIVTVFTLNGQLSENGPRFLENAPEVHELYLNIYPNQDAGSGDKYIVTQHASREEANACAKPGRIACVGTTLNK